VNAHQGGDVRRSFCLTLAYDGTEFAGWQVQPDRRTVQGVLEDALQQVTGEPSRVVASGRTDAGVHAREQVVSFHSKTRLTPQTLCRALNATTPSDVDVIRVEQAPDGFHAIRDAVAKCYRYTIQDGPLFDLFTRRYAWQIARRLDEQRMQAAASCLEGRHDFSAFEAAGAPRQSSVRNIARLTVKRHTEACAEPIWVEVEADGFLYNMVRNIVGSLVLVGQGKQSVKWVEETLASRDRRLAGPTAPAHGLMLMYVRYEKERADDNKMAELHDE
jgi:tRNA pseudouridine38-40 synthase